MTVRSSSGPHTMCVVTKGECDMTVVYNGGRKAHLDSETLYAYVGALDFDNRFGSAERGTKDITDAAAQTIAAMWHSPNGESAWLSTQGKVTSSMTISDFCTEREYSLLKTRDTLLVDYLQSYIESKQEGK